MHSLAFAMLPLAVVVLADRRSNIADLLRLLIPLDMFHHLRGAFGGGDGLTAIRVLLLLLGEFAGFTAIVTGLAVIGLAWA